MAEIRSAVSRERTTKDIDKYQDGVFIHANATKRELVELVQRLAYDDGFRAALENDPASVLAEYNVSLPAGSFRARVALPSKEDLQAAIDLGDAGSLNIGPFVAFVAFIAFINK